ncbi:response regulator [Paenibacillus hodogayensis]|uniref:Response regulator n=1 Tax=Paenibacillus hodogayensis TaxID=279208 RepID=A0ABV5VTE7_9BACL
MHSILLVEDEVFVRRSICEAIRWEDAGFTIVAEASNGREAMDAIANYAPDIVIADIFMPVMDGIDLLRTVRERGLETPFIMLTCANEFEYARQALEYGASSYILKLSMDDEQLLGALNKARVQLDRRSGRRQGENGNVQTDSLERGNAVFGAKAGSNVPEPFPIPWEWERALIRSFEQLELRECGEQLAALSKHMEDAGIPLTQAMDVAGRLDVLFSRISRKPAPDKAELMRCTGRSQLFDVLTSRMNRYAKGRNAPPPPETDHPEINRIVQYVARSFDEDISLQTMAAYVSMDENYLSGLFRKKTGSTFTGYVHRIRVNEACQFLLHTDLSVAEIGERVGFPNPSYFFKIFKRFAGCTPNEYKAQNRNKD